MSHSIGEAGVSCGGLEYWLEDSERRIVELEAELKEAHLLQDRTDQFLNSALLELKAALRERELWMDAAQKKIKELEEQAKAFVGADK